MSEARPFGKYRPRYGNFRIAATKAPTALFDASTLLIAASCWLFGASRTAASPPTIGKLSVDFSVLISSLTGSRVFLASSPSRASSLLSSALRAPPCSAANTALSSSPCAAIDFSLSASTLVDEVFPANIARVMSGPALAMSFNFSAALFILARSCNLLDPAGCACAVDATGPITSIEQELTSRFAARPTTKANSTTKAGSLDCRGTLSALIRVGRAVSGIVPTPCSRAKSPQSIVPPELWRTERPDAPLDTSEPTPVESVVEEPSAEEPTAGPSDLAPANDNEPALDLPATGTE